MMVEGVWLGGTIFSLIGLGVIGCCTPNQQQQQQQEVTVAGDNADEVMRICPDCGLENPRKSEYCGDCGFSFKSTGDNNDE